MNRHAVWVVFRKEAKERIGDSILLKIVRVAHDPEEMREECRPPADSLRRELESGQISSHECVEDSMKLAQIVRLPDDSLKRNVIAAIIGAGSRQLAYHCIAAEVDSYEERARRHRPELPLQRLGRRTRQSEVGEENRPVR